MKRVIVLVAIGVSVCLMTMGASGGCDHTSGGRRPVPTASASAR